MRFNNIIKKKNQSVPTVPYIIWYKTSRFVSFSTKLFYVKEQYLHLKHAPTVYHKNKNINARQRHPDLCVVYEIQLLITPSRGCNIVTDSVWFLTWPKLLLFREIVLVYTYMLVYVKHGVIYVINITTINTKAIPYYTSSTYLTGRHGAGVLKCLLLLW